MLVSYSGACTGEPRRHGKGRALRARAQRTEPAHRGGGGGVRRHRARARALNLHRVRARARKRGRPMPDATLGRCASDCVAHNAIDQHGSRLLYVWPPRTRRYFAFARCCLAKHNPTMAKELQYEHWKPAPPGALGALGRRTPAAPLLPPTMWNNAAQAWIPECTRGGGGGAPFSGFSELERTPNFVCVNNSTHKPGAT